MFLALIDAGTDMRKIVEELLSLADLYRPESQNSLTAHYYWRNGLRDGKNPEKEVADRTYLVFRYVSQAFSEPVPPVVMGGGEPIICTVIRKHVPQAPRGFSNLARRVGDPKNPPAASALSTPFKSLVSVSDPTEDPW